MSELINMPERYLTCVISDVYDDEEGLEQRIRMSGFKKNEPIYMEIGTIKDDAFIPGTGAESYEGVDPVNIMQVFELLRDYGMSDLELVAVQEIKEVH